MKKVVVKGVAPVVKRRATELFSVECNFRAKTVPSKRAYRRNPKHRSKED